MKQFIYFFLCFQAFMMGNGILHAQEGETVPQPPRDQGFTQTLVMIGIAVLFFYLILWRPEQKRRKEMEAQRNSLKKGDRVVAMGIIGTVASIKDDSVVLKMVDGSKIEFLKAAISNVIPDTGEETKTEIVE